MTAPSVSPPKEQAGGKIVVLLILGLLVIGGGVYTLAHYAAGDRIPRSTTVAGVKVGGMDRAEAAEALRAGLEERAAAPISVEIDGAQREVDPADLGFAIDYDASVADAGAERSWDPKRLWDYFTGGDDLDPVLTVDDATFDAYVAELGAEVGKEPVEGAVTFKAGGFKVTEAAAGQGLDPAAAREALEAAYVVDGATAALPLTEITPEIDAIDVESAVAEFANPAMSAPVVFRFGGSDVKLTPREYADSLSLVPQDGVLVPQLDGDLLEKSLSGLISGKGKPVDATVELVNGKPKVIPAKPGVTFDREAVDAGFLDLVRKPEAERSMEVPSKVDEPKFSTEDAEALGIKRRVSTFTTYFPYAEYRNINIGRAAELVNGTIVKPGETFSLNDTVGERTAENGFTEGFIISNGIFKEDLGGGVSQMATTTFNAGFFAGMTDVEHKPHSFYIDRYPVGREATVAWPTVDMSFRNDTPYGVLIAASLSPASASAQGALTVSIYSTKYWDITTKTGNRYAFTSPATRTLDTPDCYPNTGYGGFDIDIWRYWRRAGSSELTRTEKMHTTYTPSDTVICKPPEPPKPTEPSEPSE